MTKKIHSESPTELLFFSLLILKSFFKILVNYLELNFKGNKRSFEKLILDYFIFDKITNYFSIWHLKKNTWTVNWLFDTYYWKVVFARQNFWARNMRWCRSLRKFSFTMAQTYFLSPKSEAMYIVKSVFHCFHNYPPLYNRFLKSEITLQNCRESSSLFVQVKTFLQTLRLHIIVQNQL
jgi:hypothetical protein